MKDDHIYIDIEAEMKRRRFTDRITNGAKKVRDWCSEHREEIIVLGPLALGAVTMGCKTIGRHINLRKQEAVKNLYCYDRSLGHYWALRRELTNAEWLKIDQRKKNGERLADILAELRVLK